MAITKLVGKGREHGYTTCTTVSGETESGVVDLEGFVNIGLIVPVVDGLSLSFKTSHLVAGTYYTVTKKNGTAFTVTTASGEEAFRMGTNQFLEPYRYAKVVCSTAQTADREFIFVLKG